VRADEKRSPQVSEGESLEEAKSVKRNEIPQKGQFNIMVDYSRNFLLTIKREIKKGGISPTFKNLAFDFKTSFSLSQKRFGVLQG
jgi:hypothetical protein